MDLEFILIEFPYNDKFLNRLKNNLINIIIINNSSNLSMLNISSFTILLWKKIFCETTYKCFYCSRFEMLVRFLKCLKFFVESCLRRSRPVQIIQFDLSPVGKNDLVLCRECCTKLKGQSVGSYQFNRWVDCSVGDFISNFLSVIFAMLSYNTVSFSSNGAFFDSINLNWKFFEKKLPCYAKCTITQQGLVNVEGVAQTWLIWDASTPGICFA